MKNITKKQWGIVSTSIGSILIIVALLTMVGIGSNDTYASYEAQEPIGGTHCIFPSGTSYDSATKKCKRDKTTYQCCASGTICEAQMGFGTCSDTTYCTSNGEGLFTCSSELTSCTCPSGMTTDSAGNCTCPGGTYLNSEGKCVENVGKCPAGTYYQGQNHAATCPAGSYCPGGTYNAETGEIKEGCEKIACPAGSYCPEGVSEPTKCPAGKTTNTTGAKSDTYCIDDVAKTCDDGSYKTTGGYCEICPAGSYCKNGVKYDCPTNTKQGQSTCGATTTCTSIGAKCTLNGKSGTCIDSGSNVGGLVCKIETSGSDDGGNPSTPSSGNPSSGGNPNTPSGGDSGGNGNGNTNQNPNTATKTPLVIAIIGTISIALGTFAYFKGKKEINTEI